MSNICNIILHIFLKKYIIKTALLSPVLELLYDKREKKDKIQKNKEKYCIY